MVILWTAGFLLQFAQQHVVETGREKISMWQTKPVHAPVLGWESFQPVYYHLVNCLDAKSCAFPKTSYSTIRCRAVKKHRGYEFSSCAFSNLAAAQVHGNVEYDRSF